MLKILDFLNKKMIKPKLYGSLSESWFFYLSFLIMIVLIIVAVIKMKNISEKKLNHLLRSFALILIGFEIYKQVIFTHQNNWEYYSWFAFPYQFCSVPMYIALIASFVKQKAVKEALIVFLSTYALFSGLAVMIFPETVFVETIGINIQTMVHHGLIAVLGFGLIFNTNYYKLSSLIKGSFVFAVSILIAVLLNFMHNAFIQEGTFNMFFINPLYANKLPILKDIQPLVSGRIFVLIYFLGFSLIAFLILFIKRVIIKAYHHQFIIINKNLEY